MQPIDLTANMLIVGDVLVDDGLRLLVLAVETKTIDGRIRLTLLQSDGGQGLRIHRTFPANRSLKVVPLGAALEMQKNFHMAVAVSNFLEFRA